MDPTKKELYTAKRSSGVDLTDPAISEEWEKVKSDTSGENWILLSYANSNTIQVHGSGEGGLDEMLQLLSDDQVYFGCLRGSVNSSVKFYSFSFIGDDVGGMKRGKVSMHKSGVLNTFESHGSVNVEGVTGVREEIVKQIAHLSGVDVNGVEI